MKFLSLDETDLIDEDEVMFCSNNCYMQFAVSRTSAAQEAKKSVFKEAHTVLEHRNATERAEAAAYAAAHIPGRLDLKRRKSSLSLDGSQPPHSPKVTYQACAESFGISA